jgi:nicotinic acid mononucleotide adenylyltransferase
LTQEAVNVNIFKSYETIDVEFIDVSSTYIRNNIRNENVKSLLNSEVYNYIVENNLYF